MATRGSFRFLSWLLLTGLLAGTAILGAQNPASPALGNRIPLDSIVELITIKTEAPQVFPAHPNIHPAGQPRVIPISSELPVFTPGENGLAPPRTVKAEGVSVPALQPAPVPALPPKMREGARCDIQYLDVDNGLSGNNISSILEDSRGYLWFVAGDNGFNRYDGRSITTFSSKEGLTTPGIYTIFEDSGGNIWFGGNAGKVCRYDGRFFTHFTLDSISIILCITEDKQGNLWFGTTRGGAVRYDGANFTHYATAQGLCHNNVQAILEDSRGNIWFGTVNGVNCFDGRSFTRYTQNEGLPSPGSGCIAEDNQGNIWFGSSIGVSRYDGKNFTLYTTQEGLGDNYVRRILKDSRGNIWFTSLGGGISRFDGATFTHYTTKEGFPNNGANGIWEDSGGNIWITAGGVSCLNPRGFVHFTELGDKKSGGVQAVLEDSQGVIWFKTGNSWLVQYDGQFFSQVVHTAPLRYSLGSVMMEDSRGDFWFASQTTSRYDGNSFTLFAPKSRDTKFVQFHSMLEDRQGNLWFGGQNGAFRFDGENLWQYTDKDGLPPNTISSMLLARGGNIWMGSDGGGITKFDGKTFTNYYDKANWGSFYARTMLEDSQGNIWFGGRPGLVRYDGQQAAFYSTEDGLSHFNVNSIVEGRNQEMWIGTQQGITLMVPGQPQAGSGSLSEKPPYRFYTFGKGDGLNEIGFTRAAVLDRRNRLWLGTAIGLSMLDLNAFELASKPPRVMLEHIELNQKYIDFRRLADTAYLHTLEFGEALARSFDSITPFFNYPASMELPHYLNNLAFHFSGIDWAAPHKVQYRFYLEGLEEDWNGPTKENKVEYRNLPFGHFTFKIQAMGESQEWSQTFEYTFTIRPPWHRTWLAYFLWTTLLLSALYGIYRFQLSRKLAQAEAQRLKELDTFKSNLYTNITHEFRTPLTVILGMAGQLASGSWQSAVDHAERMRVSDGLKLIRRNGRNLLRLVNQMLDLSRLESGKLKVNMQQGNVVAFLKYLLESFHSLAEAKNISLEFMSSEDTLMMDFDPVKLQQIAGNLISNGIKFTPEGGKVSVSVQTPGVGEQTLGVGEQTLGVWEQTLGVFQTPRVLKITVIDNGRGIPADQLDKIFDRFYQVDDSATRAGEGTGIGLTLTKELVKLLGGEIKVESELGKGSAFTVVLPITNQAAIVDGIADSDSIDGMDGIGNTDTIHTEPVPAPKEGGKGKLLIIEDNADVVRYISSILQRDYRLAWAPNGKIGVEKAQQEDTDIIICDVMMPEMDGYEVCRRLKGNLDTSHIPIIMLTAKADFESRLEGLEQGADAYLAKPFEERELKVHLKKLLENRERLQQYYTSDVFISQGDAPPAGMPQPGSKDQEFLQQLLALVEKNLANADFTAEALSEALFIAYPTCRRKVRAATGMGIIEYIRHIRIQRAAQMLREQPDEPIGNIFELVGYTSHTYFTRDFKKAMGCTPTEYRGQS